VEKLGQVKMEGRGMKKGEVWNFVGVDRFGKRTVDDVTILERVVSEWRKTVLVYSPFQKANILVHKSELLYKKEGV
jgi:hypothetical protein